MSITLIALPPYCDLLKSISMELKIVFGITAIVSLMIGGIIVSWSTLKASPTSQATSRPTPSSTPSNKGLLLPLLFWSLGIASIIITLLIFVSSDNLKEAFGILGSVLTFIVMVFQIQKGGVVGEYLKKVFKRKE